MKVKKKAYKAYLQIRNKKSVGKQKKCRKA